MARKPDFEDFQIILLTAAATRDDGSLLPAPAEIAKHDFHIREAIGVLVSRELANEKPVDDPKLSWRIDDDTMFGAVINDIGREAVKTDEPAPGATETPPPSAARPRGRPRSKAAEAARAAGPVGPPKPQSNIEKVIDLLSRETGASMPEIIEATGWLAHSARAALSGLRKKQMTITCTKSESGNVYRIVSTK